MNNTSKVFSGRTFSQEDIENIIWARKRYPKLSRCELAGTICEITPSGRAKMKQCLDLFDILEADGMVQLPPIKPSMQRKQKVYIPEIKFKTEEINGDIQEYEPIQLVHAKPGEELKRCDPILCKSISRAGGQVGIWFTLAVFCKIGR